MQNRISHPVIAAALFVFVCINNAFAADIFIKDTKSKNIKTVSITGAIEQGDSDKLKNILLSLKSKNTGISQIQLASEGGDVIEALKIGFQIRKNFIKTLAPIAVPHKNGGTFNICPELIGRFENPNYDPRNDHDCTCASACFIIWAAGVIREGNVLGIHRPRFSEKYFQNLSAEQAQERYQSMSNEVKSYLIQMNIPIQTIDFMFSIDSDSLLFLDEKTVGSMWKVPFFDEWIKTKCKLLTLEENFEREKLFKKKPLSKAEQFYLDHLNEKYWQNEGCIDDKIIESQLKVK
jgi:hypothetical protein